MTNYEPEILPSGDSSVLVRFGDQISEMLNRKVIAFQKNLEMKRIHGVIETIPADASLLVIYNPLILSYKDLLQKIQEILKEPETEKSSKSGIITIPVCYDKSFGLDLEEVSKQTRLSIDEIVEIHTASIYLVFMLGFVPGFPYLGELDPRIACPRKQTPRQAVPEGSVGLAGRQTGIYPIESPGGWQIIGRTPLKIFNPGSKNTFPIQTGDRIRFKPIDLKEFEVLSKNPDLWKE
jgi:inhibitor of KinA